MNQHYLTSLFPGVNLRTADSSVPLGRWRPPFLAAGALLFLLVFLLSGAPAFAISDEGDTSGAARMAQVQGESFTRGGYQSDWGYADTNIILEEGDEVLTGDGGRMSVEFPGGFFMELGPRSRARLYRLGAGPQLQLAYGSFYFVLLQDHPAYERVRVDWRYGTVTLDERGSYRVDLSGDGLARVTSIRGEARVQASGGRVLLADHEEVFVEPGGLPTREASYVEGDFDNFDRSVYDKYFGSSFYRLPNYVNYYVPGIFDLARFGNWTYVPSLRSYCWRPRGVAQGWRPYTDGRWVFTRGGWAWMPFERWGYAPSHYGRWDFVPSLGWVWLAGNRYRPAWVRWTHVDHHIGWAVLGPGDRIVKVRQRGADHTFVFVRENDMKIGKPVKLEKLLHLKPAKLVVVDSPKRFVKPAPGAEYKALKMKGGEKEIAARAAARAEQRIRQVQAREGKHLREEVERHKRRAEKEQVGRRGMGEAKPEKAANPVRHGKEALRQGQAPGSVALPAPQYPHGMERREVEEGGPVYKAPASVAEPIERSHGREKLEREEPYGSPAGRAPVEKPHHGGKKIKQEKNATLDATSGEAAPPASGKGNKKGESGAGPAHGPENKHPKK
jgi:hypothetical protein